ncbi:S1 family peptidase [Raoultella ornithinolytica]|uniref:S1 family peptidase n=1 Tax=Raoultella ornithinolytica TaxID=54291 RepID=UPI0004D72029|nr:serine protease [Raoultella ornithinolytica]KDV95804.1 trypsin family protein [Raoultella ornithinolytica 2-156-04_S1_C1]KDX15321.1 trypsin family protein [Raoultella ornithinolytica 2-156-04_S1_C2]
MYDKWKKAVIHLECAMDIEKISEKIFRDYELENKLNRDEISLDHYREEISKGFELKRSHGTAIFIIHDRKRYLLTARHVLFDKSESDKKFEEDQRRHEEYSAVSGFYRSPPERDTNTIFKHIFRVPSLDENKGIDAKRLFIRYLHVGPYESRPYTFSDYEKDLAIISLDQRNPAFADHLIELGYAPIPSEEIESGSLKEGDEVFTVGFPAATCFLGQFLTDPSLMMSSSPLYSLPVFSWGRVSMLHHNLHFYWCDISIYPGNSGGPLISDGKLVGIVVAQASVSIDDYPSVRTRIPFAKIIKGDYIKELIDEQEKKDNFLRTGGV